MKNILKVILLCFVLTLDIFGQGSSIYTRYGLGDLFLTSSTKRIGIGGLGIALSDKYHLNDVNPAGWNKLVMTRFEAGMSLKHLSLESTGENATFDDINFSGISIGIPISTDNGFSLVAGLAPYSNVDYNISFQEEGDIAGNYTINYNGSGGITKLYIGSSYRLPYDWSIGGEFEYYTGKIDYYSEVIFPDSTSFENGGYKKNNQHKGIGYTFGIISGNLADIFGSKNFNDLRLGFTFNKIASMQTDTTLISVSTLGSVIQEHDIVDTNIPDRIGVGVSARVFNDYTVIFDYLTQDWNDYTINDKKSDYLGKYQKYSFGLEYKKQDVTMLTPSLEQIAWRCGLSFGSSQYRINNEEIEMFSIYAGLSYPLEFGSTLDLRL